MQTKSSLSREQVASLQSTYTCLRGITVYLESHQPYTTEADQQAIQRLLDFSTLCLSRLVEYFSEVAEREQRGGQ